MNKFLMLGIAGLAFAACSNEEELGGNQFPEGTGAVTIKIAAPTVTKAIAPGHDAVVTVKPAANSNVSITLTGSNSYSETITLTADQWNTQQEVTFWNVETPQLVTVSMNDGKKTYTASDAVETAALQEVENVPAYGETNQFTLTANTGSPTIDDPYEAGADASNNDQNKVYQLYTATVTMAIPMARLEVSGIEHIRDAHATADCKYQTLSIDGVYLDNVYANGAGVAYTEGTGFSAATGTPVDYSFDGINGTGIAAVLSDAATDLDFGGGDFTVDAVWPAAGNVFGYNFFGATGENNLPKFKIYFENATAKDPQHPLSEPRYAMITKYWNEDKTEAITSFVPGHIYRIINAYLDDENIIGDEGGNTLYGVEVTVTEATWAVETIKADWAN